MSARTNLPFVSSDDYRRPADSPPVAAAFALAGLPPVTVLLVAEPVLAVPAGSLLAALWFARRTAG
jgi:hypothetical protein